MQQILFLIHILAAIALVALILLQHGKGADMGAAFGAGASGTLFGSVGSLPFLTKLTACVAAVFFASCLGLGYIISKQAIAPTTSVIPIAPLAGQEITIPAPAATQNQTVLPVAAKEKKLSKSQTNHK